MAAPGPVSDSLCHGHHDQNRSRHISGQRCRHCRPRHAIIPSIIIESAALALSDRGATLIGDDGIILHKSGQRLVAEPHPNIAGKLEIRGVGLVTLPTTSAEVALIVSLKEESERLPDSLGVYELMGCAIPLLPLAASDIASLPLRAEWGLRMHGLPKDSA